MRIVLVGPAYPLRGGIAQYNTSLARAFEAAGDEVLVISYARQYPGIFFPGKSQQDGGGEAFRIEAEHLVDSVNPFNWPKVADRISGFKPDLVMFQWWQPFFAPSFRGIVRALKKALPVPVIFLCHNLLSHESSSFPGRKIIEKVLAKTGFHVADGFMVHSDQLRKDLALYAGGKPAAGIFHPLYDFYKEWDMTPPGEKKRDGDGKELKILYFGKIRRYKGLEVLIDALGRIDAGIPFKAVFAGECYLPRENFRQKIESLGLSDRISWEDRYIPNQEIPGLFRSADVVVLPYLRASQSGVIPVAYQFEVPVIVSDVGGLSEVVKQNVTGFLVQPGDPAALAEAITRFYNLHSREYLREGIRSIRKQFTWESVVNSTKRLHLDILKQRNNE